MRNKEILIKKTLDLYSGSGWRSLFAKFRFWHAPYLKVEELVPEEGAVIDIGCGEGFFTNYLAITSSRRKVIGIEINKNRFRDSNRGIKNAKFVFGDINKIEIPKADAIILLHVLHHLDSFNEQDKLINACYSKLKNNGRLIIVEIEPRISFKYFNTLIFDHFLVPWIFDKKIYSKIYFRKRYEWTKLLSNTGFKIRIHEIKEARFFPHIIFECRRIL